MSRARRVARDFCSFSNWLICERTCGGWVRAAGSAPRVSSSRRNSDALRSAALAPDSSVAILCQSAAASIASPTSRIRAARVIVS